MRAEFQSLYKLILQIYFIRFSVYYVCGVLELSSATVDFQKL